MMKNQSITIEPISEIRGEIHLPGSKSISNRALLLAALSKNKTILHNLLDSDDVNFMRNVLLQLGISCDFNKHTHICEVKGNKNKFILSKETEFFLGNAGTAMRFLTAVFAVLNKNSQNSARLDGNSRMQQRPIAPLIDALIEGGMKIIYLKNKGFPPIKLIDDFLGGNISLNGNLSSQYLSALLLASPLAKNDTKISLNGNLVSKPYIEMTIKMMNDFGVSVIYENNQTFFVQGNAHYIAPENYFIEGDASSATYFLAAAAIKGKVKIFGMNKNSIQGDLKFVDVLQKMGAQIRFGENFVECEKNELNGVDLDLNHIPDAAMTVAVLALFAKGKTKIRNIYNWRIKETDRLSAMTNELRKIGAIINEGENFIEITPPKNFISATIETYDDHRIAMCFSLVALAGIPITILDPDCTKKTFPNYFDQFKSICF